MIKESQDVLIAEDDDEDFELFAEAVAELSEPIILRRARNGDSLMKALNDRVPRVLFLDIFMPCRDGKDCLQEIRAQKKFEDLPIIVYSAVESPEFIDYFFTHGTSMYVLKPRTYTALVGVLQQVFTIDWTTTRYNPTISDFVLNPTTRM